jgi:hypothetical protein
MDLDTICVLRNGIHRDELEYDIDDAADLEPMLPATFTLAAIRTDGTAMIEFYLQPLQCYRW